MTPAFTFKRLRGKCNSFTCNTHFVYMAVDFTMYMYIAHVQYMCLPFTNYAMGIGYTVYTVSLCGRCVQVLSQPLESIDHFVHKGVTVSIIFYYGSCNRCIINYTTMIEYNFSWYLFPAMLCEPSGANHIKVSQCTRQLSLQVHLHVYSHCVLTICIVGVTCYHLLALP